MSTIILRIWKSVSKGYSIKGNWVIWDRGDEMWELKGDVLRHFGVLERTNTNNVITERLKLLRESAIPLEAIRHTVQDWEVEDSVEAISALASSPLAKPVLPLTSSPLSTPSPSPRKKGNSAENRCNQPLFENHNKPLFENHDTLLADKNSKTLADKNSKTLASTNTPLASTNTPLASTNNLLQNQHSSQISNIQICDVKTEPLFPEQASEGKKLLEKLSQEGQELQGDDSSQHFYNHPMELWSSLSQWIPQHALFQPSLHHQASLELSDTPAQTYPYQIYSSENSRSVQDQPQYVRQPQQTRPYHLKTSSRDRENQKRPLFI